MLYRRGCSMDSRVSMAMVANLKRIGEGRIAHG
jgi:hypothetical protein